MPIHLFVPRWMDRSNTNSQNANARALLSRFKDPRARWTALCGGEPADFIRQSGIVSLRRSTARFWQYELAAAYQSRFDAVFYPGPHWGDQFGLKLRRLSARRTPVIAVLEGIIASPDSVERLSKLVGHAVFSQPGTAADIPSIRWLYGSADHIIAVSPFLRRVAALLYGEKVSCLPLGVDTTTFHSARRQEPIRCRIVGCGTVKSSKNPQMFLRLAARYKDGDFVWFGGGEMVQMLTLEARRMGLDNLQFPGALPPALLAEEFRKSSIFVLPSHSEGVPKVTQEAAACGLPIVLHGFFESPSVVHERNGLVAWSDEELSEHVGALIHDPAMRLKMGQQGTEMSKEWDWDLIAPQWEDLVIQLAG